MCVAVHSVVRECGTASLGTCWRMFLDKVVVDILTIQDETYTSSRNVGHRAATDAAPQPQQRGPNCTAEKA
jgi:hypothetical protein